MKKFLVLTLAILIFISGQTFVSAASFPEPEKLEGISVNASTLDGKDGYYFEIIEILAEYGYGIPGDCITTYVTIVNDLKVSIIIPSERPIRFFSMYNSPKFSLDKHKNLYEKEMFYGFSTESQPPIEFKNLGSYSNIEYLDWNSTYAIAGEVDLVQTDIIVKPGESFTLNVNMYWTFDVDNITNTSSLHRIHIPIDYGQLEGSVSVNYVDEKGEKIIDSEELTGNVGTPYDISIKDLEGYTFLRADGKLKGNFEEENQKVDLVYSKNKKVEQIAYLKVTTDGEKNKSTSTKIKIDLSKVPESGDLTINDVSIAPGKRVTGEIKKNEIIALGNGSYELKLKGSWKEGDSLDVSLDKEGTEFTPSHQTASLHKCKTDGNRNGLNTGNIASQHMSNNSHQVISPKTGEKNAITYTLGAFTIASSLILIRLRRRKL